MFLIPPPIPFLPKNGDTAKLLGFGSPVQLKNGVVLREKSSNQPKTIHSLYDLEMNVKYLTDGGNVIRRINQSFIAIKKKPNIATSHKHEQGVIIPQMSQSKPINIPDCNNNSVRPGSYVKRNSLHRFSLEGESHSDEKFDAAFARFGTSPLSPGFEDFDFMPSARSKREEESTPNSFKIVVEIQTPNVPGEKVEKIIDDVLYAKLPNKNIMGALCITNYQLIFSPYSKREQISHENSFFMEPDRTTEDEGDLRSEIVMIPLTTIAKFDKVDRQSSSFMFGGGDNSCSIDVFTKDIRKTIRFLFDSNKNGRQEFVNVVTRFVFPHSINDMFACCCAPTPEEIQGWNVYDPYVEYQRMGVGMDGSGWSFSKYNMSYQLCDSYPQVLVVPTGITEEDLLSVAAFRSKARIPVLAWRNRITGVSLSRCSQPKTGVSRTYRCKSDEKLIRLIQQPPRNGRPIKMHILDARPMTNAIANMALGGGYENIANYPDCELDFLGIANIHNVRDSWNKLRDLCELQCAEDKTATNSWLSQFEATNWLYHLVSILSGSVRIAQTIDIKRESVLIHCSDGWDRTPQVCSLAQLMLDREYRTIKGFCVLIEKEWLHFGHKFADRSGTTFEDPIYRTDNEKSPVFLQFLDATYQMLHQFPYSFEFTDELLVTLMEHVFSSRFGTFLLNSDKERKDAKLAEKSASLWSYILSNVTNYANPFYQPHKEPSIIYPSLDIKDLCFWKSYFLKYMDPVSCVEQSSAKLNALGREFNVKIQNLQNENEKLREQIALMQKMELASNPPKTISASAPTRATKAAHLNFDWVDMSENGNINEVVE